jgi:uncharacterized membrane protein
MTVGKPITSRREDAMTVKHSMLASSALVSALAMVASVSAPATAAQISPQMQHKLEQMLKAHPGANESTIMKNMERVHKYKLARCYGINAVGRNDCASGAHSCAGQSTQARDPSAFVLLPMGDCGKIAGGTLKGPM